MTTDIATQLMHCENSKQLWDEAQSLAGAQSRSQITYLKSEFHGIRKGNLKMEEYLTKMKKLTDQLKLVGNPVTISDLIIQILNGLDSDYNPIVVKLSYQSSLTWVDLQAQLLAFESRLDQLNKLTNMSPNASANVVNNTEYKGNKFNSNTQNSNWRGSNFRNHRGGRSKGRMFKPTCQVCNKTGHITMNCFHRFDKSYSNLSIDANKGDTHSAYLASPHYAQDYDWYFDSGASNHVTHQTETFQDLTEHNGKNSLVVGNGVKLDIIGTSSSNLNSLKFHNMLYVPNITKN